MIITVKFNTLIEANYWCRGGIFAGFDAKKMAKNLVGQTITFASPSGSCTFTQPTTTVTGLIDFVNIKSQLETAISGLKVDSLGDKIVFYPATGSTPVSLAAVSEGGRIPLGFANDEAISGVFLNAPAGSAPAFVGLVTEVQAVYITYEK
jgi:hypothetical protein